MTTKSAGPSRGKTVQVPLAAMKAALEARLAAPAGAPPRALRIEREGQPALTVRLYEDRDYTFGRAPEASYVMPSDAVSRLHGQLLHTTDRRWVYRDLASRNGTYSSRQGATLEDPRSNAYRVPPGKEREMHAGDVLLLGDRHSRLVFLAELPESVDPGHAPRSAASRKLDRDVELAAQLGLPVFLLGPSGVGKTWLARRLHELSGRTGAFVLVNCGRLPTDPAQLHSELLGHVRGAYTGAAAAREGKFEAADNGTLFLDEIESLPRTGQDFLLDLLDGSGSYARLGAAPGDGRRPQVALISASKAELGQSGLRADLVNRLAAGSLLRVPSLEERREDIPALVQTFLDEERKTQGIDASFSPGALRRLVEHRWPGQVRELEAVVQVLVRRAHASRRLSGGGPGRLVLAEAAVREELAQRERILGAPPAPAPSEPSAAGRGPRALTRADAQRALDAHDGNKTRAAKSLGVALNTFKARLRGD